MSSPPPPSFHFFSFCAINLAPSLSCPAPFFPLAFSFHLRLVIRGREKSPLSAIGTDQRRELEKDRSLPMQWFDVDVVASAAAPTSSASTSSSSPSSLLARLFRAPRRGTRFHRLAAEDEDGSIRRRNAGPSSGFFGDDNEPGPDDDEAECEGEGPSSPEDSASPLSIAALLVRHPARRPGIP